MAIAEQILAFRPAPHREVQRRRELAAWLRAAADTIEDGAEADPTDLVLVLLGTESQVIRTPGTPRRRIVDASGVILRDWRG